MHQEQRLTLTIIPNDHQKQRDYGYYASKLGQAIEVGSNRSFESNSASSPKTVFRRVGGGLGAGRGGGTGGVNGVTAGR